MLDYIKKLDKELLLFINNTHSPLWDEIMIKATDRFFWIPFYVLIGVFLIWKFRKKAWLVLLVVSILIIFTDQFTSALLKPMFERLRPCHDDSIKGLLRLVYGCGGKYGFVSSHAANTFALSTFLILLFNKQYWFVYFLYAWALFVSYSRIYLGAHYPGDILGGAIAGILFAFLFYRLYLMLTFKLYFKSNN